MKSQHIPENDLALYVSGDLPLFRRMSVRGHARHCDRCTRAIEAYRADLGRVKVLVDEMPAGVNWDRLSQEMTANIRVGLAAGECVALPKRGRLRQVHVSWRPAAFAAGIVMVLSAAWLLNMPQGTTAELGRAMSAVVHGHGNVTGTVLVPGGAYELDRGPVVVATRQGIELRENNSVMGGSQDARPVAVSVSMHGSASARYVNDDTLQMTITSVYGQ